MSNIRCPNRPRNAAVAAVGPTGKSRPEGSGPTAGCSMTNVCAPAARGVNQATTSSKPEVCDGSNPTPLPRARIMP